MGDANKTADGKDQKTDNELSELLDSALEDFGKAETAPKKESGSTAAAVPNSASKDGEGEDDAPPAEWNNELFKQAMAEWEQNLTNIMGEAEGDRTGGLGDGELQARFQQMAQMAQQVIDNPTVDETSTEFSSAITQTLQGLSAGREDLGGFDFESMLSGQAAEGFMPFMQGMMQSLLSKEVLYPSLKDIIDKYPAYLEENKDKLSAEDKDKYTKQLKLMQDVCEELDKETADDSVDVRKERFEKVLKLMQQLQDHGTPPAELVGDMGNSTFPNMGMPDPEQCCIA